MSAGNPFRRARGARIPDNDNISGQDGTSTAAARSTNATLKKKKKVVIQTPPHSPEEPRRSSAGRLSPPPLRDPEEDQDSSDGTTTADSDLERAMRNTRRNSGSLEGSARSAVGPAPTFNGGDAAGGPRGAPYNPFARTLATSEAAFGLQRAGGAETNGRAAEAENMGTPGGRPMMDVDQFKNILMGGSAMPLAPASSTSSASHTFRSQDSSSNTDISSPSQQSLFDPYFELHQETPRSSFDQIDAPSDSSDGENEEQSGLMSGSVRLDDFAPPAPPKALVTRPAMPKGPVTVSFADFDEEITDASRTRTPPLAINTTGHMRAPLALHRSPSDLNKPLPPPPADPVGISEVPKVEIEEGTPVTPQVSMDNDTNDNIEMKKAPPPPPAARRGGQPIPTPGRARSSSNATQESSHDDTATTQHRSSDTIAKPAPPPPPSRKTKSSSQPAVPTRETVASTTSSAPAFDPISPTPNTASPVPPPPPRRMASRTGGSLVRTPSTASRASVQKESGTSSTSGPPAPPPRRALGSKRESTEVVHRSGSDVSAQAASSDMLSDLAAFQAEIDALRAKAGQQPG